MWILIIATFLFLSKIMEDGYLKNLLPNGSLRNQKWLFYGITWRIFWSTFIFKFVKREIRNKIHTSE